MKNTTTKPLNQNKMNITHENEPIQNEDSVLMAVMAKYWERSRVGQSKYGTNLDRLDV